MELKRSWIGSKVLNGEALFILLGMGLFGLAAWFTIDTNAFKTVSSNLGSFENNLANAGKIIGSLFVIGSTIQKMVSSFINSRLELKKMEMKNNGE